MSKIKLSDLAAKPITVRLIHPIMGDIGAWIKITSTQTNAYILKSLEIASRAKEETNPEKLLQLNAELIATLVTDWDEEFFEMEFNTENVVKVFSNTENLWIRNLVETEASKQDNFFTKKKKG
jgi:hypothetical protein